MLDEASLALMVSVGHRTGLFDVMAQMPAATSAEIASRASLRERYVREWLAAMTAGGSLITTARPGPTRCPQATPPCSPSRPA